MEGRYAESQQSEERLEEEGSVSRSSRETGPAAASDFGAHSPVGSLSLDAVCVSGPRAREGAYVVAASSISEASSVICSAQHEARYRQPCLLSLFTQQTQLPMALAPARTVRHLQPSLKVAARQCLPPAHKLDLLLIMPVMLSKYEAFTLLCSDQTQPR